MRVDSRQSTVDSLARSFARSFAGWLPAIVMAFLLFAPEALACSVCFDSKEERRMAFMVTTVILTVLPLGLVFGTIFWLRKIAASEQASPPAE